MARYRKAERDPLSARVPAQTANTDDSTGTRKSLERRAKRNGQGRAVQVVKSEDQGPSRDTATSVAKAASEKAPKRKASAGDAPASRKHRRRDGDPRGEARGRSEAHEAEADQGPGPGPGADGDLEALVARVAGPLEETLAKQKETLAVAEMMVKETARSREEAGRGGEAARAGRERMLAMTGSTAEQVARLREETRREHETARAERRHMLGLAEAMARATELLRDEARRDREEARLERGHARACLEKAMALADRLLDAKTDEVRGLVDSNVALVGWVRALLDRDAGRRGDGLRRLDPAAPDGGRGGGRGRGPSLR